MDTDFSKNAQHISRVLSTLQQQKKYKEVI